MRLRNVVLCCLVMTGSTFAEVLQTLPISVDKTLINDLELRPTKMAERRELATAMRTFLEVDFAEIKRVCKPSKGQLANLEAAADAAVEREMERWLSGVEREARRSRNAHPNRSAALESNLWTDAVEGILNASQKQQLQMSRADRLSRASKTKEARNEVRSVAYLDLQLLLEASQCERIAKLLAANPKDIKKARPKRIHLSKSLAKRIAENLTEAQIAKWKELRKKAYDSSLEIHVE